MKTFVLASRTDGFGSRLGSLLNAKYLAYLLGDEKYFKLLWLGGKRNDSIAKSMGLNGHALNLSSEIFEAEFNKEFVINSLSEKDKALSIDTAQFRTFEEFKRVFFSGKYKYLLINQRTKLYWNFRDIDIDEYKTKLREFYDELPFLPQLEQVRKEARQKLCSLQDYTAVHFRTGDVIFTYSPIRKCNLHSIYFACHYPLVMTIIEKELNQNKQILLIGDDKKGIEKIVKFFDTPLLKSSDDFIDFENLNETQSFLFDVEFLRAADFIYETGSALVQLANILGKDKSINSYKAFDKRELYANLNKFTRILPLNDSQNAFAYFHLFLLAEENNENDKVLKFYLKKALSFDRDNDKYRIYLLSLLLKNKEIKKANRYLELLFKYRFDEFMWTFFNHSILYDYAYGNTFKYFCVDTKPEFSKLNFLSALIAYKQKEQRLDNENVVKNLQDQSNTSKTQLNSIISAYERCKKFGSAQSRIKTHLAYKLGQAMIFNSKSFLGYIRMLYVLSYIKAKHKAEQKDYETKIAQDPNLKLPKLEIYDDYEEALKIKEHLSYKLGEALIKRNKEASNNVFKFALTGGGLLSFYMKDVPDIKKEFKKKKEKK